MWKWEAQISMIKLQNWVYQVVSGDMTFQQIHSRVCDIIDICLSNSSVVLHKMFEN